MTREATPGDTQIVVRGKFEPWITMLIFYFINAAIWFALGVQWAEPIRGILHG